METTDLRLWITDIIRDFVETSPTNSLGMAGGEKCFDTPLVGFSNGADPLYDEYKRHIGPFYLTPCDFFQNSFPAAECSADNLTVISWILPSTEKTRQEQAARTKQPSERWARTRWLGEECNITLRKHLVRELENRSIPAVAPMLSPLWQRSDQGPYAPCSNWSERHAAYAAGLGTFGLCDGLITPVGKAVRIGSVIVKKKMQPSQRVYTDHHAWCLHFTHDTCRECIDRCPVSALSKKGHDKNRCMKYTEHTMNRYIKMKYDIDTYACGLCQTGVSCTSRVPEPPAGRSGKK
jgi:epoxyqueuosine reductase QueG